MRVQEIMSRPAATCRRLTNLAEAAALMWENDCGAVPVVDDAEKVIGMLTDRDICVAVGTRGRLAAEILAEEVVSGRVYVCRAQDDLQHALSIMTEKRVRRLPVVDPQDTLLGVLSIDDILTALGASGGKKPVSPTTADVLNAVKSLSHSHFRPAEVPIQRLTGRAIG